MNIIENYQASIQNIKKYFKIPLDWEVTFNIYKTYYWQLSDSKHLIFYYVSIEDYLDDVENYLVLPITQENKWYKLEDIPENYSGEFEGEEFTALLVDDDQYPEDLVFAIFDNNKNLDTLEETGKLDIRKF